MLNLHFWCQKMNLEDAAKNSSNEFSRVTTTETTKIQILPMTNAPELLNTATLK